jgi:hypothetical protein
MAYVPKDAEWFLAQHVQEIRVQGRKRNVVHINYVLIEAKTPEDAYRKAIALGKTANQRYENPEGRTVTIRFLGLRNLDVIHDTIEHGCEIMFSERVGMTKAGLRRLVRKKRQLEAFLPVRNPSGRPDYSSKEIMDEVSKQLAGGGAAEQRDCTEPRDYARSGNRKPRSRGR